MDVTTTVNDLKLVAGFVDGDTRTISYPNPRVGLTAADIDALDTLASGVLIGDKYGAQFSTFKQAYYHRATKTQIDLSGE